LPECGWFGKLNLPSNIEYIGDTLVIPNQNPSKNYDTQMYALREILNKTLPEKEFVRLNPILFGKIMKGWAIQSKESLTRSEIYFYRDALLYALKNWSSEGHRDWIATEIVGMQLTVKFIRKGTKEEERFKLNGQNKRKIGGIDE
jgi:hypothetical protein